MSYKIIKFVELLSSIRFQVFSIIYIFIILYHKIFIKIPNIYFSKTKIHPQSNFKQIISHKQIFVL